MALQGLEGYRYYQPQRPLEIREAPATSGTIVAIGGNADEATLTFVRQAMGYQDRLFVSTLASGEPQTSFQKNLPKFTSSGLIPIHLQDRGELLSSLDRRNPLFLAGGSQDVLMEGLGNTGQDRIRQFSRRGGFVAGTSAGAAVLGDVYVQGDRQTKGKTWHIREGLGLIKGVAIDMHFHEEHRGKRLYDVVRNRGVLGIGLDENTGVVVNGETLEVIGVGGVHVVTRDRAIRLTQGDKFGLQTQTPLFARS